MAVSSVKSPFQQFFDLDGSPLEGSLYIGQENQDPRTNPIIVYWDSDGLLPVNQPIKVVSGYPSRNGSPAVVYVNSSHSIRVENQSGKQVFYYPQLLNGVVGQLDSGSVLFNQSFIYQQGTVGYKLQQFVSVKDAPFNAQGTGLVDDTAAFSAAGSISSSVFVHVPAGIYLLNSNPAPTGSVTWVIHKGATFTGAGKLSAVSNKIVSYGAYRSLESDTSFYNGIFGYLEQNAAQTNYGTIGSHSFAQSSGGSGTAGEADIAVSAFAAHNLTGSSGGVWGLYSTVLRQSGVNGATHGMEIDVANFGTTVPLFPSSPFSAGLTSGIWLCAGGETTEPSAGGSPGVASVGLAIIQNDSQTVTKTAKFDKGILFHNKAINGADGTGGTNLGCAIAFATGHSSIWHNNSNQVTAEITNSGSDFAQTNMRLDFANGGISFQDRATGISQFFIEKGGTINFANSAVTGSAGSLYGYFTVKINNTEFKIPMYNL